MSTWRERCHLRISRGSGEKEHRAVHSLALNFGGQYVQQCNEVVAFVFISNRPLHFRKYLLRSICLITKHITCFWRRGFLGIEHRCGGGRAGGVNASSTLIAGLPAFYDTLPNWEQGSPAPVGGSILLQHRGDCRTIKATLGQRRENVIRRCCP